jgi:hypothetical protein
MVERQACHGEVETSGFIQIFDPGATKDPTLGRLRIDGHDLIASPA